MRPRSAWRRAIRCRSTRNASRPERWSATPCSERGLTPLLQAVARRGCPYLVGTDMLFEQIPAYLEFFGYGTATPDELRALANIRY